MSRRIFQRAIVAGVLAIVLGSFAQTALAACTDIVCIGKITRLYTQSSGAAVSPVKGAVFIGTDGDETDLDCTPEGQGQYIVLLPNQKLFKEIYASLLAGVTNNLTMQVRIDENSTVCKALYVTIENP